MNVKMGLNRQITASGSLGLFDITDDLVIRIVIEGADAGNTVVVRGRIKGQSVFSTLQTITGSANTTVTVATYEEIEIDCTSYSPTVSGVKVVATSFDQVSESTEAKQDAGNSSLTSIDVKTPTLDNGKQPVIPSMTAGGNLSVQTAATGTNWTAFASQALKQLTVSNQTGTNLEFRQGGAGVGFIVPNISIFTFFGITNANQIEVRRVDTSNTQVTVTARWES